MYTPCCSISIGSKIVFLNYFNKNLKIKINHSRAKG